MNPAGGAGQPLRVLTLNVNGLRDAEKRRTLFEGLRRGGWHAVLLQETHHEGDVEGMVWTAQGRGPGLPWDGTGYWKEGSRASCGVAVLIARNAPITNVQLIECSSAGRLLRIDCEYCQEQLSLVSVYAPVEQSRRAAFFLDELLPLLPQGRKCVIGGDFNCVASDMDQVGPLSEGRTNGFVSGLQLVQAEADLLDVWREQHPAERDFTHKASNGHGETFARLDRFLVSAQLMDWAAKCKVLHDNALPGDHVPVELCLQPPKVAVMGRGAWVWPLELVGNEEYSALMEAEWRAYARRYGSRGARAVLDGFKTRVRVFTESFCKLRNLRRGDAVAQLQKEVARAEARWQATPEDTRLADLQEQLRGEAQQIHQRASAAWVTHGEQPSFSFHNQLGKPERRITASTSNWRRGATMLSTLAAADGSVKDLCTEQGRVDAASVLTDAFSADAPEGLYRAEPVDEAAQDELLRAVDKVLSPEQAVGCEGPARDGTVTLEEAKAVLKLASRGKRPGTDGLPYEFWAAFEDLLLQPLVDSLNEAFASGEVVALPRSMREGLIVLLYKGAGSREEVGNYRPITLLNSDYKLMAKILVNRIAVPLDSVLDVTQSAFVPGRWIGDNVMYHMEEIAYVEAVQETGCIAFLDFQKAYDRVDREWLMRCAKTLGFLDGTLRWFAVMHAGTSCRVLYNGWRTDAFPVKRGMFQGSPLSPPLYNISAQPMAAALRRAQESGALAAIALPDGTKGPPSLQHADDTTLHAPTVQDLKVALDVVETFCRASNGRLNKGKTKGMVFGSHPPISGVCPTTGITFVGRGEAVRHLGIPLSTNAPLARKTMFNQGLGNVIAAKRHWVGAGLSYLGRVYIAKQIMANSMVYQASFDAPTNEQANAIASIINGYVSKDSCGEGVQRQAAPSMAACSLPLKDGGLNAADVKMQMQSLRAKVIARYYGPMRLIWKPFLDAQFAAHSPHLGAFLPLSCAPLDAQPGRAALHPRLKRCVEAFRKTNPHRIIEPSAMEFPAVMAERLFANRQITDGGQPLHPGGRFKDMLVGPTPATMVQHLRGRQDQLALQLVQCLPAAWQAAVSAPEPASQWSCNAAESLVLDGRPGDPASNLFTVHQDGRVGDCVDASSHQDQEWQPCLVVDVSGNADEVGKPVRRYLQGAWAKVGVDSRGWGHGKRCLARFSVGNVTARSIQMRAKSELRGYAIGASVKPKVWELPALEGRWQARCDVRARGSTASASAEESPRQGASYAAWMSPSPPRPSRDERAAMRASLQPKFALTAGEMDDTVDAAAPAVPAESIPWKRVWDDLHGPTVLRTARGFGFRLYHAALPCGALRVHNIPTAPHSECLCTHAECNQETETLTHLFLDCPAVRPAIDWLCSTWEAVTGDRPPATAEVIIAADPRAWTPSVKRERALWTVLRLTTLQIIWARRCRRNAADVPLSAAGVAAMVVHMVRDQIMGEWRRVTEDITDMRGVCKSWYRGRRVRLDRDEFVQRWCIGGTLCTVSNGVMSLKFSKTSPSRIPI
jgi:exonuclease III